VALKVILAGHNVDRQALDLRLAGQGEAEAGALSPETLSAAYARISRDPRSVDVLRAESRREVDRARRSNRSIIFEMGHASVAEHAVFNLDVLGLSRLAVEALEHHRLMSFTEKSQRYIRLEGDFVVPPELLGGPLEADLRARVAALGALYQELARALTPAAHPGGRAASRAEQRAQEARANEDARYALPLCATAQLGMTANARSLELAIARLAGHPLAEARALGAAIHAAVARVAPSVIRYTEATPYFRDTGPALAALAAGLLGAVRAPEPARGHGLARLVAHTPEPDREVAAALLFAHGGGALEAARVAARALAPERLQALFAEVYARMQLWDALPRAWEAVGFTFELTLSAAAFGQLKRHRMSSQLVQPYDPALGRAIPDSVREAGLADALERELERCEALHARVAAAAGPAVAAYCLTNAHRRRVLVQLNGRALGHFARLRCDAEAQWDIRALAHAMVAAAREVMPLAGAFYGGKDCVETLRTGLAPGTRA